MRRRWATALVGMAAAALTVGAMAAPVGAGGGDTPSEVLPSLTVTKAVVATETSYTIPNDQKFTVIVSCYEVAGDKVQASGGDEGFTATLKFNPDGSAYTGDNGFVPSGNSFTYQGWKIKNAECTVTEQASGATQWLAGDPTYECDFTKSIVEENGGSVAPEGGDHPDPGCISEDGTDPAMLVFSSPYHSYGCMEPPAEVGAEFNGKFCVQSGVVTVTNTIAEDPAKVASGAVVLQPKFTG